MIKEKIHIIIIFSYVLFSACSSMQEDNLEHVSNMESPIFNQPDDQLIKQANQPSIENYEVLASQKIQALIDYCQLLQNKNMDSSMMHSINQQIEGLTISLMEVPRIQLSEIKEVTSTRLKGDMYTCDTNACFDIILKITDKHNNKRKIKGTFRIVNTSKIFGTEVIQVNEIKIAHIKL